MGGWLRNGVWLVVAVAGLVGCSQGAGSGRSAESSETIAVTRGLDASDRSLQRSPINAREPSRAGVGSAGSSPNGVAMTVGDTAIDWATLKPRLVEAAGATALEELVLDALLERRAAAAGVTASPQALEHERTILIASYIESGVASDRTQAERLVAQVRASRGLGQHRFDDMLRRNALLRSLIADQVRIDEAAIQRAYELRHGRRHRVRLITTNTVSQATRAGDRIKRGEDFSRVAAEVSTDPSAARGGVVEPISTADLTYPETLRQVLQDLPIGSVSSPIALENGYAIVIVDAIEGPRGGDWAITQQQQPSLDRVRSELIALETRRQERLLMDQLVRELLASPVVRFDDPDLARAWRTRNEAR